ncbi:MAG TPA: hypothetical protein PKC49_07885, partial [Phycisphaerae bacterium]|nr:hypothetical protein [Phycisphaerae bacterium]
MRRNRLLNRRTALVSAAVLVLGLTAGPAQGSVNLQLKGQWGGACRAVAVSGSNAFVGFGGVFTVLNVSQPANPTIVSQLALGSEIQDIVISGTLAYVALGNGGLQIVDIA